MADLINAADSLNAGRGKINAIIKTADAAVKTAANAATTANEAKTTANSVQTQLDTIILVDGASDAEVVQSRVDKDGKLYATLKERLDSSDAQLADIDLEKATKTEVSVERARIDSFTSLAVGSTTGDAELIDSRVGSDGITRASAGAAMRAIASLFEDNNLYVRATHNVDGQFVSGTTIATNAVTSLAKIPVTAGEEYVVSRATVETWSSDYLLYLNGETIIGTKNLSTAVTLVVQGATTAGYKFTPPANTTHAVLTTRTGTWDVRDKLFICKSDIAIDGKVTQKEVVEVLNNNIKDKKSRKLIDI